MYSNNTREVCVVRRWLKNKHHDKDVSHCRDASDAVHERDGYNYDGYTLRVEFPRGGGPGGPRSGGGGGGYGFRGGGRGLSGGRGGPPSRRSEYRVLVSG